MQPNFDRAREPGNYDNYIAYLDKLKAERQHREQQLNLIHNKKPDFAVAPKPIVNNNSPAAHAYNQANYDR